MSYEYKKISLPDEATKEEKDIADKYIRIRSIVVEGEPDPHTYWIIIDNQQFCLFPVCEDIPSASWHCWMLAKALQSLRSTG